MRSLPRSASRRRGLGFTLVELMVGVAIGLLASLAVTQVLVNYEGQKRSAVSGSDAQINGALAMHALQRAIAPAGYGFSNNLPSIGCPLSSRFNGGTVTNFISTLAPIVITQGASGAPDTVRVIGSAKGSYSLPIRVVAPGYNPGVVSTSQSFPVANVRGIQGPVLNGGTVVEPGDLMVAVTDATQPCQVFQVTATPATTSVERVTQDGKWNMSGFPTASYGNGAFLINLGQLIDRTYSVSASNTLQVTSFTMDTDSNPSYPTQELFTNIVQMRALYGKDTNADGVVDVWDNVTPTTNAGWQQLLAVRVALVARSNQFEREEVTQANPLWDVGTAIAITGTATCGTSNCLSLKIDGATGWKNYRYKVFETTVPLRNMLWNS